MKLTITFVIIVLCLLQYIKSDIPTHCLTSQVHGKWKFTATKVQQYNTLKSLYTLKNNILEPRTLILKTHYFKHY